MDTDHGFYQIAICLLLDAAKNAQITDIPWLDLIVRTSHER